MTCKECKYYIAFEQPTRFEDGICGFWDEYTKEDENCDEFERMEELNGKI